PRLAITGRYVVDLDGRADLGPFYGKVKLLGLTLDEARAAIEEPVRKIVDNPDIAVTLGGWEEDWQRLEDEDKPRAAPPKIQKEELRYNGKTFDQWRKDLLTELKPEIRIDGIKAMREFGVNGYGEEAMQVILDIMRGFDVSKPTPDDKHLLDVCQQ